MASTNLTAAQVMDMAAARLNDVDKTLYSYTTQIPYLNVALAELQEHYEANNVPVTDQTSAIIEVDAASEGFVEVSFDDGTAIAPFLPDDLIEPKVVWESPRDLNQFTIMTKIDYLPQYQIGAQINQFVFYQWASNQLKMIAANANNDLKLDYVRSLFIPVTISTDELFVINSLSFLGNRTASLIAHDIEENDSRSQALYADALLGLDRSLSITTKGRQRITIRRRPFRAGFKTSRLGY
jgi:hypothetical protein